MTRVQLWAIRIAIVPVIVAAAWNSYWHMVHVALSHHQDVTSAYMFPLSVDGLLLIATVVLSATKDKRAQAVAWLAVVIGFSVSLTCNILASPPTIIGRGVSGWFAVSLLLGVELLQHTWRSKPKAKTAPCKRAAPAKKTTPVPAAAPVKAAPRTRTRKPTAVAAIGAPVAA